MHFGAIWKCRESFENKDTKFGIMLLCETKFWNCREHLENKNAKWCTLALVKSMSVCITQDTFHAMEWTNRQWKYLSCEYQLCYQLFDFWEWWYARAYMRMSSYGPDDNLGLTFIENTTNY